MFFLVSFILTRIERHLRPLPPTFLQLLKIVSLCYSNMFVHARMHTQRHTTDVSPGLAF